MTRQINYKPMEETRQLIGDSVTHIYDECVQNNYCARCFIMIQNSDISSCVIQHYNVKNAGSKLMIKEIDIMESLESLSESPNKFIISFTIAPEKGSNKPFNMKHIFDWKVKYVSPIAMGAYFFDETPVYATNSSNIKQAASMTIKNDLLKDLACPCEFKMDLNPVDSRIYHYDNIPHSSLTYKEFYNSDYHVNFVNYVFNDFKNKYVSEHDTRNKKYPVEIIHISNTIFPNVTPENLVLKRLILEYAYFPISENMRNHFLTAINFQDIF